MRRKMSSQDSKPAAGELQQKIEANNSPGTEQFWNWKTYFFGKNKKHGHLNFQKKQETVKNKKHWNNNFSRKTRNIEARSRKTKRMEHKIECMLQTHPPKSCEMPRCRNDEIKPNARKPLNHTHACKNITWDDNVAIIITLVIQKHMQWNICNEYFSVKIFFLNFKRCSFELAFHIFF